ncbi:MAG: 2-oxoacid:acceptor oxidoreductase family protein [Sphaerochaetaceae bacterium]|jgi:2-oxoglutarate ferredoxin oxidoreductase subunit gamma|nr:2-oxoacid:acceptor oxidoreductase family protein [Sphaerochaetaceae bacterium]MDD3162790.1 2-oxoacid:acceptor oxidoreductase family protein [Sphaerochaetaceae bacterium]MDD4007009.1 2-oxoacid:acceptor oxidoreductase family protein [Sphaerochaetaceae bacterium]MDD4396288.1 2-oxoacid:acceptor oxidoreductase family protein [Sphaerochaetaceae bacterium]
MSRQEIRLAGSGGQGIILATVILAEAAIQAGMNTAQSQAYGPEARGGSCKAETLISDQTIGFTKVQNPTFLMALTQKSLDQYGPEVSENCLVLIDSGLSAPQDMKAKRIVALPILDTARTVVGKIQTANIVAVGCINDLLGITDAKTLEKAVLMHVPSGTEQLNIKALEEGFKLAEGHEEK